jgi:hypothetical protein
LEIEELQRVAGEVEEALELQDFEEPLSDGMTLNICNGLLSSKGYIGQTKTMLSRIYEELMGKSP